MERARSQDGLAAVTTFEASHSAHLLHALFEEQVCRTPFAPAIAYGSRSLTYVELDRLANRLAHCLRRRGAGPEARVAVLCERSLELPVALLGILKAGAAWVPLNPEDGVQRRDIVVTDAAPVVLLAQKRWLDREAAPNVFLIDEIEEMLAAEADTPPETDVTGSNAAYVIFTSGTTGRPKGVINEHRGVASQMLWMRRAFPLRIGDRVLQKTPISFDVSVWEIFWPLTAGATLVIADPGAHRDPIAVARTIARERITTVHFVPSMLRTFLDLDRRLLDDCATLRWCVCSGEALPRDLIDRWHASIGIPLFNLYGPTETAVHVSWRSCPPCEYGPVPIGSAVDDTRLSIVDEHLMEIPHGAIGELAIGGLQVGRGYIGRPDLTAERFVPDPFGPPGARLYLSGDVARLNDGGEIEYLGRRDDQMKVRGVRIEAGEVETALRACDGVDQAAVTVRQFAPGDDRLIAWIVCDGSPPDDAELRRRLNERLPEAMVPSMFIAVDALPMTTSGKVDRKALRVSVAPRAAGRAPRNEREHGFVATWEEILGMDFVGVDDDFIADLGGNSLQAARIAAALRGRLGVDVSVADILQSRTIAALAAASGDDAAAKSTVIPREHERSEWPLSAQQEGFWFLGKIESSAHAFNIPLVLRLSGSVDVDRLSEAVAAIVRRHRVLRVVFRTRGGALVQLVDDGRIAAVNVVDLRDAPEDRRNEDASRLRASMATATLDVERGDVARFAIVCLGASEYELLATFHHAVFDGESIGVFRKELERIYVAGQAGLAESETAAKADYLDYAMWQRRILAGAETARDLQYWRDSLRETNYRIELPVAHVPSTVSNAGAHAERIIDAPLAAEIRRVCAEERITQFTFLLSAFAILLHRYSGQNEIVIGSPFAGRTGTESLIGCFINTLPLRIDLGDAPSCRKVMRRAWEGVLGAFRHQGLPAATLVRELGVPRDSPSTPLFQVVFNHLGAAEEPGGHCERLGLQVLRLPVPTDVSRLDLSLYARDVGDAIWLDAVYKSDLFTASAIAAALDHFVAIVRQMTSDLGQPVSQLEITPPRVPSTIPAGRTTVPLMTLINDVAQRRPHATAVSGRTGALSYGDLRDISHRLAAGIAAEGVQPNDRVALLFEHDAAMIVAMFGVMAAGAGYVPLNPHDPDRRLRTILKDARPSLLVADAVHLDRARSLAMTLCKVVEVRASTASVAEPVLQDAGSDSAAAYLLYTSGSTGHPKGVIQSRENLLHHACTYAESIGITPTDRVGLIAAYTLDAAVMDIYGALTSGASLHLYDLRERGFTALGTWLAEERITIFHSTPTVFRHLLEVLDGGADLAALRWVVLGGEAMERRDVTAFQQILPRHVRVVNGLGPTESTTALQQFLDHGTVLSRLSVPVGRPVRDTEVTLWNDAGEQGAVYGTGEIVIRSAHVALGYWNRDELTRQLFLSPDEFGRRGYRTGDIGRWLSDGSIEFVGRRDNQVKIRGHRVELEEIAGRILEAGIAEVAVKPVDGPSGLSLAAFFVSRSDEWGSIAELKKALASELPAYMVPSHFVQLEAMPLTASGKIDLRALALPDGAVDLGSAPVMTDEVESELCAIWASVLNVAAAGSSANFFSLGGDSLMAMKAAFLIKKRLGVDIPLRDLFERPVPAELAPAIRAAIRDARPQPPPLETSPRCRYEPVSLQQIQMLRLISCVPQHSAYSNMIDCVVFDGPLSVPALSEAVDTVRMRHETLRSVFAAGGEEAWQTVLPFRSAAVRLVDLRHLAAAERAFAIEAIAKSEQQTPFVLAEEPLLRLVLIREAAERNVLFVITHHLTFDRWAKAIFYNELLRAYVAAKNGVAPDLPPLPVQYADYARWQRECRRQGIIEDDLRYWKAKLRGCTTGPVLTISRKRPAAVSSRGAVVSRTFPPELLTGLRELSRQEGVTLFMMVLSAFYVVLHRQSGSCDLVVGAPIAGRSRPELEQLIGFFANSVLLRTELSPDWSFRCLLAAVSRTAAEAYSHQEAHFDEVLQATGHPEIYRIKFALQDIPGLDIFPWRSGELAADLLRVAAEESTRRDLNVYLAENDAGLAVEILYRAEMFDAASIESLLEEYEQILAAAVVDPAAVVSSLAKPAMGAP